MTDSSNSPSDQDDFLFPNPNPDGEDLGEPRRKRRRTGRSAKESAALGIFGSESEDEGPGRAWKTRDLRNKGMGFVKSTANGELSDTQAEAREAGEDSDEEMNDANFSKAPTFATPEGLGFRGISPASKPTDSRYTPGFIPTSARQTSARQTLPEPPSVDSESDKPNIMRPSHFTGGPGKGKGSTNSFAAKMMAKMGYVEGQGLGTSGQGIVNPIEAGLRPQGVGLGAIREKTKQAKEEEKREAARRGEILEDSSEEERKRRRKLKEKRRIGDASGASTPESRPKIKYRTAADLETAAQGLQLPNILKSLIDATGSSTKLLTSTAGLMSSYQLPPVSESAKLAKRAKRDLEAFVEAWNVEKEKETYNQTQRDIVEERLTANEQTVTSIQSMISFYTELETLETSTSPQPQWEELTKKLESLQNDYPNVIDELEIQEAAVAVLDPLFQQDMQEWGPLNGEVHQSCTYLRRLNPILHIGTDKGRPNRKATSPYESMIYFRWLPRARASLLTEWEIYNPTPAIQLIENWKRVAPRWIIGSLIKDVITPKLLSGIDQWKPRSNRKHHQSQPPPHKWLFPWLQHLDNSQLDLTQSGGLVAQIRRKLRMVIDRWDISRGVIDGLREWKDILGHDYDRLMHRHLLPRLASYLRSMFEVQPQNQDLTPFHDVLRWKQYLSLEEMAELFTKEFFPKWLEILHIWLTSEPNYEEVGQWFSWWKEQFPNDLQEMLTIKWDEGLKMMNEALELGDKAVAELPLPQTLIQEDRLKPTNGHNQEIDRSPASLKQREEPMGFKDVLDEWCASEDLQLVPLREAHVTTGLPLFRVTASVNRKGGVVVYLKGDVVWAQNRKMKDLWEPIGLDNDLVARAEGK